MGSVSQRAAPATAPLERVPVPSAQQPALAQLATAVGNAAFARQLAPGPVLARDPLTDSAEEARQAIEAKRKQEEEERRRQEAEAKQAQEDARRKQAELPTLDVARLKSSVVPNLKAAEAQLTPSAKTAQLRSAQARTKIATNTILFAIQGSHADGAPREEDDPTAQALTSVQERILGADGALEALTNPFLAAQSWSSAIAQTGAELKRAKAAKAKRDKDPAKASQPGPDDLDEQAIAALESALQMMKLAEKDLQKVPHMSLDDIDALAAREQNTIAALQAVGSPRLEKAQLAWQRGLIALQARSQQRGDVIGQVKQELATAIEQVGSLADARPVKEPAPDDPPSNPTPPGGSTLPPPPPPGSNP